ncbi:type I pullulanase [Cytobacillus spongiae]|uniref:type I pullulanase n=1 Tax=Cytobacillus spongiae TaxID=2901381 RepID=UPI001F451C8F|nr:type I pullulanase [Cytobacillus spongiae]UII55242.1 type I pullulanase [Cytobacillus spongiae]
MISIKRDFYAYLDKMNLMTILLPYDYHNGHSTKFTIVNDTTNFPVKIERVIKLSDSIKYICKLDQELEIGTTYWIEEEHGGKTDLQIGAVIRTEEFDASFYYDGRLGVSHYKDKTIFTIWAPTASQVKLKLVTPLGEPQDPVELKRHDKGVWQKEVVGDLEGYLYSYLVCINLEWREANDPYAVAVTANGKLGVVVDLKKTAVEKKQITPLKSPVDAIIYETHIRDFTVHEKSGVKQKGLFLGAAEIDTVGVDGSATCLSYVKELGVTHLELLPVNDYGGIDELTSSKEYNWGYNPIHFNTPDGSYSSDPNNPYARIVELKKLINVIHEQGIGVIIDVVYNHVYIREESTFEKVVPGYFFRHDEHGMPSNGTGVGNDIASERKMVRKFILDSVLFWLMEYDIDGFRFDLMGILDIDTMNEVKKIVERHKSGALIIGEGWDLNTPLPVEKKASIRNQEKLIGIGHFNDWFRDAIKGSTFNIYDRGYCLGNESYYESAKQVLAGSIGIDKREQGLFSEPFQSVNYVESHDNHTLWDKLTVCFPDEDELNRKRHRLASVMVLLSQGIPFLHSGQEFFRTKKGVGNSYQSPDEINQLDWDRKTIFAENVAYLKGIIDIRMSHRAFRFASAKEIREHLHFLPLPKPVIGIGLREVGEYGDWNDLLIIFNPTTVTKEIQLPKGNWYVLANNKQANSQTTLQVSSPGLTIEACSAYILAK